MALDRLLLLAWMLNAYDAAITTYAVTQCGATELNPLMRACLAVSVLLFLVVKLGIMTGVCSWLWRWKDKRPKDVRRSLLLILVTFMLVCSWNTYVVVRVFAS